MGEYEEGLEPESGADVEGEETVDGGSRELVEALDTGRDVLSAIAVALELRTFAWEEVLAGKISLCHVKPKLSQAYAEDRAEERMLLEATLNNAELAERALVNLSAQELSIVINNLREVKPIQ